MEIFPFWKGRHAPEEQLKTVPKISTIWWDWSWMVPSPAVSVMAILTLRRANQKAGQEK